jgi:hypothetical protein
VNSNHDGFALFSKNSMQLDRVFRTRVFDAVGTGDRCCDGPGDGSKILARGVELRSYACMALRSFLRPVGLGVAWKPYPRTGTLTGTRGRPLSNPK